MATKRVYDPVKRREYYLRTRELKGRPKAKGGSFIKTGMANIKREADTVRRGQEIAKKGVITKADEAFISEVMEREARKFLKTSADLKEVEADFKKAQVELYRDHAAGKMNTKDYNFEMTIARLGLELVNKLKFEMNRKKLPI